MRKTKQNKSVEQKTTDYSVVFCLCGGSRYTRIVMRLFSFLKQAVIPHEENDYKPHLFREVSVAVILFGNIFLLGTALGNSFFLQKTVLGADISSAVLIDLTNQSRLSYGESPLIRNAQLDQAARMKAEDMSAKQYFSHNSPQGVTPWYWFKKVGYQFLYAGENLAINFNDSHSVQEAWLRSPSHRANILNVDFTEIGLAAVWGEYNNTPSIYIVQLFGTPAKALVPKVATSSLETVSSTQNEEVTLKQDGKVLGDFATDTSVQSATTSELEEIVNTQETAVVKNNFAIENKTRTISPIVTYSTWYEKILFKYSFYIDIMYKVLFLLMTLALVTMILIEIRKQHYKHIAYGLLVLIVLTICIYINQGLVF